MLEHAQVADLAVGVFVQIAQDALDVMLLKEINDVADDGGEKRVGDIGHRDPDEHVVRSGRLPLVVSAGLVAVFLRDALDQPAGFRLHIAVPVKHAGHRRRGNPGQFRNGLY